VPSLNGGASAALRNLHQHKKDPLGTLAATCTVRSCFNHPMTGINHHAHAARSCHQQEQQRCAAMRPVAFSVWNKKTGAGNQN
jgi:hypothetical protein